MVTDPPIHLVVLYGGESAEHAVSCISAAHVVRALDPDRYHLEAVAITTEGRWMRSRELNRALGGDRDGLPDSLPSTIGPGEGDEVEPRALLTAPVGEQMVVLPVLHGPRGEDGTIQGLLEILGVAYVGSGVLGSSLNMDKSTAKVVAAAAGLPIAAHLVARDTELEGAGLDTFISEVQATLGWPVFVKPANMGSSVGITRATDPAELRHALEVASAFDEWLVVEEGVNAREIEVGVIGSAHPRASVPGEIVPTHAFYDYEDKYLDGAAEMVVPADLPPAVADQARAMAVEAFRALRCEGLARVDFFYEETGSEGAGRGLLLNEVNTMPGFTPYSMFPSLWAATGLPYRELLDELVDLALARHDHRSQYRRTT